MISRDLFLSLIILFTAIWFTEFGNVTPMLALSIAYIGVISWDLIQIVRINRLCLNLGGPLASDTPLFTSIGRRLLCEFSFLHVKLNALKWQADDKGKVLNLPGGEILENARNAFEDGETPYQRFFESVIQSASERFRAQTAAIVVHRGGLNGNDNSFTFVLELEGKMLPQVRFKRHLYELSKPFLAHGAEDISGIYDLFQTHGVLGDLSYYGFRHVLVERFSFVDQFGNPASGVVFLLYLPATVPFEGELLTLRELCRRMELDLHSKRELFTLADQVAEANLKDRRRGEFLTHISHDIRSPLNNVRAILKLFQDEQYFPSGEDLIEIALANCTQVAESVEDVIDFSRHQAGKLEPRREPINLNKLMLESVNMHQVSARLKGLRLFFDDEQSTNEFIVSADKRHLKRVASNLISNAVKYTRNGWVKAVIRQRDLNRVELKVEDSGIGMSKEQLDLLFTPFTRFPRDDEAGSETDGVGLGLSLSRILVELNGGEIDVKSRIGQGSCFSLNFPLERIERVEHLGDQINTYTNAKKQHILVLDDDPDSVESLARHIEKAGHEALRAFSVVDAIGKIKNTTIDRIVTDFHMPDGGGRRLLTYIAQHSPQIPVMVLSGRATWHATEFNSNELQLTIAEKPCNPALVLEWIHGREMESPALVA